MSRTVEMEWTGIFGGSGKTLLPSYGHRSAVRPLQTSVSHCLPHPPLLPRPQQFSVPFDLRLKKEKL